MIYIAKHDDSTDLSVFGNATVIDAENFDSAVAQTLQTDYHVEIVPVTHNGFEIPNISLGKFPDVYAKDDGGKIVKANPRFVCNGNAPVTYTNRYKMVQHHEVLKTPEGCEGLLRNHRMGILGNGEKAWRAWDILEFDAVPGDPVKVSFLALNALDKSNALTEKLTTLRMVCNNQTNLAAREIVGNAAAQVFKVKKTGQALRKWKSKRDQVQAMIQAAAGYEAYIRETVKTPCSDEQYTSLVDIVAPMPEDNASQRGHTRAQNIRSELFNLYQGGAKGSDLPGVQGTMWGAYNAITEYLNHCGETRVHGGAGMTSEAKEQVERDQRFESVLFGRNGEVVDKVSQQIYQYVTVARAA